MSNLEYDRKSSAPIESPMPEATVSTNMCVLGAGLFSIAGGLVTIAAAISPREDKAEFTIGSCILFGVAGVLLLFGVLRRL
jgi:uncharacterized membrane protein HdeD (DUF308 family)